MKHVQLYTVILASIFLLFSCGKEEDENHYGEDFSATISGEVGEYSYVDLGLSVKWATCNVGATQPTAYGNLFAWGETKPKDDYSWNSYRWCLGTIDTQIKYCASDNETVLAAEDDAATVNWGDAWRMPSLVELQELVNGCNWQWSDNFNGRGIAGQVGISKVNGNVIFLPADGFVDGSKTTSRGTYGSYWSSTRDRENVYGAQLYAFYDKELTRYNYYRCHGRSVRAVVK